MLNSCQLFRWVENRAAHQRHALHSLHSLPRSPSRAPLRPRLWPLRPLFGPPVSPGPSVWGAGRVGFGFWGAGSGFRVHTSNFGSQDSPPHSRDHLSAPHPPSIPYRKSRVLLPGFGFCIGFAFRVSGYWSQVSGFGSQVSSLVFRACPLLRTLFNRGGVQFNFVFLVSDVGSCDSGIEFQASGFGFRVSRFGYGISCFGFQGSRARSISSSDFPNYHRIRLPDFGSWVLDFGYRVQDQGLGFRVGRR
jgi:hypothetical protein